jgi:hypothetical protein
LDGAPTLFRPCAVAAAWIPCPNAALLYLHILLALVCIIFSKRCTIYTYGHNVLCQKMYMVQYINIPTMCIVINYQMHTEKSVIIKMQKSQAPGW